MTTTATEEKRLKIIDDIKKEIPWVDVKPFSHNIIGIKLKMLDALCGIEEVDKLIANTPLCELGWSVSTKKVEPEKKEEPSWEDLIGYPKGVYDSFAEMIYGEYGEDSEQANDLNRAFREARIRNDPSYGENTSVKKPIEIPKVEPEEIENNICCGCGKYDDTRPICDCGGSHRFNCEDCEEKKKASEMTASEYAAAMCEEAKGDEEEGFKYFLSDQQIEMFGDYYGSAHPCFPAYKVYLDMLEEE